MTEQSQTDAARAGVVAQKLVEILAGEASDTRIRAVQAAMVLLGEGPLPRFTAGSGQANEGGEIGPQSLADFFNRDEKQKPADYAQLCAAYHFSLYGMESFTIGVLARSDF